MTPSGIERATSRVVAHYLNQQRHRAPLNNNPSNSLMRVFEKLSKEALCSQEVRSYGQAEGAGRRMCVSSY